jgi:acyl-coenzyme A thioesterase PaaI-like protein
MSSGAGRSSGGYVRDDLTEEEISHQASVYGPLADAVRRLADACIRTEVDDASVAEVTAAVEALTARLQVRQMPGAYGVRFNAEGHGRPWGNAVVGLRNPIAPPLQVRRTPEGRAWADFHLGAAYEGPPDLVHGGVSALILDQLLGEAAGAGSRPGMTGTLTLRYRRATPLGSLHAEAAITGSEGHKTLVSGAISDAEGVTVEAEGVFILPRWARAALAEQPDRFE